MWRIYIILTLWLHPLNAQYVGGFIEYTRGEGERGRAKNTLETTDNQFDYKPNLPPPTANHNNTVINHAQNKNSRDSFRFIDTFPQNNLFSHVKELKNKPPEENVFTNTENSLSTKSIAIKSDFTTTQAPTAWKNPSSNSFDARLFNIMSSKAQYENLVYSPISFQTILAFIFTVSDGKLYEELAQLLAISQNRSYVATVFENIIKKFSINAQPTKLIMANKLYYDYHFAPIDQRVRIIAKKSFGSELQQINFFESEKAANLVNSWVRNKTHDLIKEIITSSSISGETSGLLLNCIYFKSEWLTKFAPLDTERQVFFLSKEKKIMVDMMYNEDVFRYGDFSEDLQATVVELPYKTSNLSMLLILPIDLEGLSGLERKLRFEDFNAISQKLKREIVTVKLPKFKIGYEVDMIAVLQQMGLHALFNNSGIINLFKNPRKPFKIDQFKHKSFVNVNEAGTEAAAITVAKYVPLSMPTDMKHFVADHPFLFVIRDTNTTFFMGHVVKF